MPILANSPDLSNAPIQFCGVSVCGEVITATFRKGSRTRSFKLDGFDVPTFSAEAMRKAWRQAARRGRRQRRPASSIIRRRNLIIPGGAAA